MSREFPPVPAAGVYRTTRRVAPGEVDVLGHVNNVVYVQYLQDAAVAHWLSVVGEPWRSALTWVVRRHEIDYLRPAFPDDELAIRTWVGVPGAATWDRFTEIRRPEPGAGEAAELVARARSVWVALDAATMRPRRIVAELRRCFERLQAEGPPQEAGCGE